MRSALKCQRKQHKTGNQTPEIDTLNFAHIELLDKQIKHLDGLIAQVQKTNAELTEKAELLNGVKAIGAVVCSTLLAYVPELGTISDKQLASLIGLAPINRDSGTKFGRRCIGSGRKPVRDVLYQAAVVASNHNPQLKNFAQRLKAKGKPHKVMMIAVARKLLITANAVIRTKTQWKET